MGTYDVLFPTHPPTLVTDVHVREGKHDLVELPTPGSLVIQAAATGYAVVLDAKELTPVFQFEPGQLKGRHTLQPGNYTLVSVPGMPAEPCTASKNISPSPLGTPPTSTSMVDTHHITIHPTESKDTRSGFGQGLWKPDKPTTKWLAFVRI